MKEKPGNSEKETRIVAPGGGERGRSGNSAVGSLLAPMVCAQAFILLLCFISYLNFQKRCCC